MRDCLSEFQTSPAIFVVPASNSDCNTPTVGIYEFLSKSFAYCPVDALHWLSYFNRPRTLIEAKSDHPNYSSSSLDSDIDALVAANFLVEVKSEFGRTCNHYRENWEWDLTTAAFHFTVMNNQFCSLDESISQQLDRLEYRDQPKYFWRPQDQALVVLPNPLQTEGRETIDLLSRRRSIRSSMKEPVTLEQLSSCLFASFGFLGQVKSTTGYLPLTMTPSGGARNPYEAYIIVRRCAGLKPGVYHYCAIEHALGYVRETDPAAPVANFFAEQDWVDDMSIVVVMVAVFERTMWKYQDPNAYRVILIEAGHKAQNFMIMATRLGMTACPTAALAHDQLADLLLLEDKMMQVPIYAFSLDKAMPNKDEIALSPMFAKLQTENGLPQD